MKQRSKPVSFRREVYEQLYIAQQGRCAICGFEKPLCIDHNPKTRRVRGLLCDACNSGIGHFRDDPSRLEAARAYLEQPSNPNAPIYRHQRPLPEERMRGVYGEGSVYQRTDGRWVGSVCIQGKRRYFYGHTREQAEVKLHQVIGQSEAVG